MIMLCLHGRSAEICIVIHEAFAGIRGDALQRKQKHECDDNGACGVHKVLLYSLETG